MLTLKEQSSLSTLNTISGLSTNEERNIVFENGTILGALIETASAAETTTTTTTDSLEIVIPKTTEENYIETSNNRNNMNRNNNSCTMMLGNSSIFSLMIDENLEEVCTGEEATAFNNHFINEDGDDNENSGLMQSTNDCVLDRINHDNSFCNESISQSSNNIHETSTCSKQSCYSSKQKFTKKYLTPEHHRHRYHHHHHHHLHHHNSRLPPQYSAVYLDAGNPSTILPPSSLTSLDGHLALSVPVIQRSHESSLHRNICIRWFSRSSLPFVIGILALGGVACTLGGIVLGSTGLIEHSTQYLSAALLMIGIGISLLVISGAIWKLSLPEETDTCHCISHIEVCQNCNSPYCNNRIFSPNYHFHEFQHRPPPPSYIATLNEYTLGLFYHDSTSLPDENNRLRISTPPPSYRSYNSLRMISNAQISQNTALSTIVNDNLAEATTTTTTMASTANIVENLLNTSKDTSSISLHD